MNYQTTVWHSGSGDRFNFNAVLDQIRDHIDSQGKIFIGSDSFITGDDCVFATAICLHGADNQPGGKYFFKRTRHSRKKFTELLVRILREVQDSVEISLEIAERFPNADLEIHVDVGTGESNKTNRFVSMLTAYAKSSGFSCKVKPYAWASASVADRHSKKYL